MKRERTKPAEKQRTRTRTVAAKSKRKRTIGSDDPNKPSRYGGFMPHPPKDCKAPVQHVDVIKGIKYVDLTICVHRCGASGKNSEVGFCERAKQYLKAQRQRKGQ